MHDTVFEVCVREEKKKKYCRLRFECIVKRLWMVLYKSDCNSNDCELPSLVLNFLTTTVLPFLAVYLPIVMRSSGVKDALYFCFLPHLAWFTASSRSDAAVTTWFTSLRTFGDSWACGGVGRLTWLEISTNTLNVIVPYWANENTWVFALKGHGHVYYYSLHILFPMIHLIASCGKNLQITIKWILQSNWSRNQNPTYSSRRKKTKSKFSCLIFLIVRRISGSLRVYFTLG